MNTREADIAVIGAGPAGIAAASRAAEAGRRVVLLDENPGPVGGQIWRGADKGGARAWRTRLAASGAHVLRGSTVIGRLPSGELLVDAETPFRVQAPSVVLATGARELFLPFPGWTLPGVSGVGGLQALVKSGYDVRGKKVLIAGSGPLLLAVAASLADRGASILAMVEQADGAVVRGFAMGLWRHPGKLIQAGMLRASLFAVPYWTGAWVVRAEPVSETDNTLKAVTLFDGRQEMRVECDLLAIGYGLVPNTHLAHLLGCTLEAGFIRTDDRMLAAPGVYAAGEPTGIGGVEVALIEGQIAGLAAAGKDEDARRLTGKLRRARAFATHLNQAFALRPEVKKLAKLETVVCRCEDVVWGRIRACSSWRDAKLQTRCGMGPCQGRICGPAVAAMTGWPVGDARPPAASVAMRALLELMNEPEPAPAAAAAPEPAPVASTELPPEPPKEAVAHEP